MTKPQNVLTLHRAPDRDQFFRDTQTRPPVFDDSSKLWIVTDPAQCAHLLASGNLKPCYNESYEALERHLGTDFSDITFALAHIPLCQHGDPHLRSRRRVSEFLAERKASLSACLPRMVAEHFSQFALGGRIEVMREVIEPFVLEVISTIIDIDFRSAVECSYVSTIFDKSIGMSKRRRIAGEVSELRAFISSHLGPDATDEDVGIRLALVILGNDALKGTLGESLHRLLVENSGRRLSEIAYPDQPPQTGVPFIERGVDTPFEFAGQNFAAGDRVRIFLQAFASLDALKSRRHFFGAGPHVCLGRPLSIEAWKEVSVFLAGLPFFADVISYAELTGNYTFLCPEHLELEVYR